MPREVLRLKLQNTFPDINIVAEASNIEQGFALIQSLNPDLIFLDINMPNGNGFKLLDKFSNPNFEIIFITAYQEYALEAFKNNAIGYIVKPIKNAELIKVVTNAIDKIKLKIIKRKYDFLLEENNQPKQSNKLTIHSSDEISILNIDEIIRCEGWEKYTYFHTATKKILSTQNIGRYKDILEANGFFHCHKSHLINKKMVVGYDKHGFIILTDNSRIPLARRRRTHFQSWIDS
jgi:two-component system LytT family response regulator